MIEAMSLPRFIPFTSDLKGATDMSASYPIVYVRGYAGTQSDVEETVDDPTYGFNTGSTHIRQMINGKADIFMFVSPFARLFRDPRSHHAIHDPNRPLQTTV
jgi:hypothetical protein